MDVSGYALRNRQHALRQAYQHTVPHGNQMAKMGARPVRRIAPSHSSRTRVTLASHVRRALVLDTLLYYTFYSIDKCPAAR